MQNSIIIILMALCGTFLGFIYFQESQWPEEANEASSVYNDTWLRSFDQALSQAKTENKKVLMVFTGSDWCPPCKSLHKKIFSNQHFIEFAKKDLVLLVLDFPRKRKLPLELAKQNAALQERFDTMGYPTLIIANANGEEVGRFSYRYGTPKEFTNKISKHLK